MSTIKETPQQSMSATTSAQAEAPAQTFGTPLGKTFLKQEWGGRTVLYRDPFHQSCTYASSNCCSGIILLFWMPFLLSMILLILYGVISLVDEPAPEWLMGFVYTACSEFTQLLTILWVTPTLLLSTEKEGCFTAGLFGVLFGSIAGGKTALWFESIAIYRSQAARFPSPPIGSSLDALDMLTWHLFAVRLAGMLVKIVVVLAYLVAWSELAVSVAIIIFVSTTLGRATVRKITTWQAEKAGASGAVGVKRGDYTRVSTAAVELSDIA